MTGNGTALARQEAGSAIEQVLVQGNLAALTADQRVTYYNRVCESMGLNPLTTPFAYIVLNNKLTLYAKRDATDQLRKINGVSVSIAESGVQEGVYIVRARATDKTGRNDEAIGAVALDGLKGEGRANALMKAETKAKRRVTLSICGLGWLDETEAEPLAAAPPRVTAAALLTQAKAPPHDPETGEIRDDLGLLPIDAAQDLLALASRLETDMMTHETQAELKAWFADSADVTRLRDGSSEFYADLVAKVKARMKALPKGVQQ